MNFDCDARTETPESQGVDSAKLQEALEHLGRNVPGTDGNREVVILRNGVMIWRGADIDRVHQIWSCTKSFTSTALGLLIDDGKCSLDTLACQYVPELREQYPQVALRHFASMTSGYDAPGGSYGDGDGSATPLIPAAPIFPPGTKYLYWDDAMNQFGHVLTRLAGEPLVDLFKRRIAVPLGLLECGFHWGVLAESAGIAVNCGSGNRDQAMRLSVRGLARFGHLFLNRGLWKDKRLISAEWVAAATRIHVPASLPFEGRRVDGCGGYGLNWWINGVKADGRRRIPHAPPDMFWASGLNNNKCFVIPSWNMVLARTSTTGASPPILEAMWDEVFGKLGLAISAKNGA